MGLEGNNALTVPLPPLVGVASPLGSAIPAAQVTPGAAAAAAFTAGNDTPAEPLDATPDETEKAYVSFSQEFQLKHGSLPSALSVYSFGQHECGPPQNVTPWNPEVLQSSVSTSTTTLILDAKPSA